MQATPLRAALAALALAVPSASFAWGDEGHQVVASLAYKRLTPKAKKAVDALLAKDTDKLTAPDFTSRATWADKYRDSDRNTTHVHYNATRKWHFVDIEIDDGTLKKACDGRKPLPDGVAASQGPANACVVDKIAQFQKELASPDTPAAEKLLALKFTLHLVGDLHQPLHAANHGDSGGNAVPVEIAPSNRHTNLHSYWDTYLVQKLGTTVPVAAASVAKLITPANAKSWSAGSVDDWAAESNADAKKVVYNFSGEKTFVDDHDGEGEILDAAYEARALPVARLALAKGAVRLANVLNEAFK